MTFTVKSTSGGVIHRFTLDEAKFDLLHQHLCDVYQLVDVKVRYTDDDGDLVSLSSDAEMVEAFRVVAPSILKVTVDGIPAHAQKQEKPVAFSVSEEAKEQAPEYESEPEAKEEENPGVKSSAAELLSNLTRLLTDKSIRLELVAGVKKALAQVVFCLKNRGKPGAEFETVTAAFLASSQALASHPAVINLKASANLLVVSLLSMMPPSFAVFAETLNAKFATVHTIDFEHAVPHLQNIVSMLEPLLERLKQTRDNIPIYASNFASRTSQFDAQASAAEFKARAAEFAKQAAQYAQASSAQAAAANFAAQAADIATQLAAQASSSQFASQAAQIATQASSTQFYSQAAQLGKKASDIAAQASAKASQAMAERLSAEEVREEVHEGVVCDGCNAQHYITGNRFKCTVCPDFDLCTNCESKGTHPQDHPLLKMRVSLRRPAAKPELPVAPVFVAAHVVQPAAKPELAAKEPVDAPVAAHVAAPAVLPVAVPLPVALPSAPAPFQYEDERSMLGAMGFADDNAMAALVACRGNVERAIQTLLN